MQKKSLAIITARGGSKRIPRKNIKNFLGFPIIKYSIDAALLSKCFDEVMVSTDDKEIAKTAISFGVKVPFFRSDRASNDMASLEYVIDEVLLEYKKIGDNFKYICCILPTAPFISSELLIHGFHILQKDCADSVFPVCRFSYPIQRALKISENKLHWFSSEYSDSRSQDLEPAYHDSGQFYWINVESYYKYRAIIMEKSVPIVLSELKVHDIDTEEDWKIAELKYQQNRIIDKI